MILKLFMHISTYLVIIFNTMATNISQKEWLDFLDLLHNKLRNAKGLKLTQLPALCEISNFMLFRFTDSKKIVGIKLADEERFKNIYKNYATDEKIKEDRTIKNPGDRNSYKLWNAVYNTDNDDCLILKYIKNDKLRMYLRSSTNKLSAYMGCN